MFAHKALLISVNVSAAEASLYEATRFAWKISRAKATQAEVILATRRGLIVGAFVADDWLEATAANFPGRDDVPGRLVFVGREAPPAIARIYVGKRVPDEYRKRGAANPIKYTWDCRGASSMARTSGRRGRSLALRPSAVVCEWRTFGRHQDTKHTVSAGNPESIGC